MHRVIIGVIAALGFMGALVQCAHKEPVPNKAAEMQKWHGKMHVLAESLSTLLPLTSNARAFNSPKNRDLITAEVIKLKTIAHSVDMTKTKPTNDPGVAFMAERFASDMDEAVRQLANDNRPYARRLIQQSTAHCIACHTRTDEGRSNLQLGSLANLSGLSKIEQANFYIAVRDYDKALDAFDKVINSPDAQIENPYDLELAAEKALAIAIRVKRDPFLADELVSRVVDARWAPVYLRLNAMLWKKSIQDWRNSPAQAKLTAKDQFDLAKRIMSQGWKVNSTSSHGQAGLVHFLRASAILHDLLSQSPNQVRYADYLYYAGLAAESLRDMNLWTLQDGYYEACVRNSPRTPIAKKCYLRYESIQFSSYATDEGATLPRDVRARLSELRGLSQNPQDQLNEWELMGE